MTTADSAGTGSAATATVDLTTMRTLADVIRVHAAERPDAPALDAGDRSVTFAELDARSSRVAHALAAAGVGAGDRVAFIDKNGLEWFEVTFGLAKLGAVNVSVNWRLAPPEMAQIIEDARAEVVIVGPDFVPAVERIEGDLAARPHDRRRRRPRPLARLRGLDRRPAGRRPRRRLGRERRRVPAVHLGHDRAAQGRDAQPRQLLRRGEATSPPSGGSPPTR